MNTHTSKRHPLVAEVMAVRLALGLLQSDVAERGGLNRNTVGTIESGKRNPSLDMFTRYCEGVGVLLKVCYDDQAPAITAPAVYTTEEVADRLRLSEASIFALVKEGKLGSIKNGRYRRFTEEHVLEYLNSLEES